MVDDIKPGFDTAEKRWELPGGRGGRTAWIIQVRGPKYYWGVSLHRSGGEVVRWYGPFADLVAARDAVAFAKRTSGWPLKYNK